MSLKILVKLIASERNPHNLISRISADALLLEHARRVFLHYSAGLFNRERLTELCQSFQIQPEYFEERLRLVGYALHMGGQEEDYYALLHVDRSATDKEIKRAFRRLSIECHPDSHSNEPESAERFMTIHRAYKTLSDPELRRRYDLQSASPRWVENDFHKRERSKKWKYRLLCEIGMLLLLLLILSFLVDSQRMLTNTYYASSRTPPEISETGKTEKIGDQLLSTPSRSDVAKAGRLKKANPSELTDEKGSTRSEVKKGRRDENMRKIEDDGLLVSEKGGSGIGADRGMTGVVNHSERGVAKKSADLADNDVKAFLDRYVSAYQNRNSVELLRLFSPDAVVNGGSIDKVAYLYRDGFRKADRIECWIEEPKWSISGPEAEVSGLLHVSMRIAGDSPLESRGPMRLLLVHEGASLLIKRMDFLAQ